MNYRKISRVIAIFEMTLAILLLVLLMLLGIYLVIVVFAVSKSEQAPHLHNNTELVSYSITFVLLLLYCAVHLAADWRLIKATERGTDPTSAVYLCQLWLILTWISIIFGIFTFLYELLVRQNTLLVVDLTCLIIQGMALFCVHKFKSEMNAAISHSYTQSICFTQLDGNQPQVTINGQNFQWQNSQFQPADQSAYAKNTQSYPPPPPSYNPYYQ